MTVIIAELSSNHCGDLAKAKELITAAARVGCDMVKIQTYRPEDMPNDGGDYEKHKTPLDWYAVLFDTARRFGIPLFSSVFAPWAVNFLDQFDCPVYKIASPESTRLSETMYLRLAEVIHGRKAAKLWASSGITDFDAMVDLVDPEIMFFCKKGYPAADLEDEELEFIYENANGFSDHTKGRRSAVAAIGARVQYLEKHFKLDDDCPDAAFSLNPDEMCRLCRFK